MCIYVHVVIPHTLKHSQLSGSMCVLIEKIPLLKIISENNHTWAELEY